MRATVTMFFLFLITSSFAQTGRISGKVIDEGTGKPLEFATYRILGQTYGGVTDFEGKFKIVGIPPGAYTIEIKYIGYVTVKEDFKIAKGERKVAVYKLLEEAAAEGQEVLITAQLQGQRAAIQQQINSDQIINVVSKDKIEEIPDQNAAETVGRIAGVSLQRDGGEATKVSIRGLSPRYNSININGERIPATDAEDRSVDLSMVSTDALEGIEVYKAITPDQDGDAVGGTVNFIIKKAPEGFLGNAKLSGGYNAQQDEFGQPRGNFSMSNRFFNNKVGVILTGNYQRANRSSDLLTGSYVEIGEDEDENAIINVENINLADRLEVRERYGGSLSLDYDLGAGSLMISSFLGVLDRDEIRYRTRYRPESSRKEYELRERETNQNTLNNTLTFSYKLAELSNAQFDLRASYATTNSDNPLDRTARFREAGAFSGEIDEGDLENVVASANNDLEETFFQQDRLDFQEVFTRKYTVQVDLKVPLELEGSPESYFKIGGKMRDQYRTRNASRTWSAFSAIDAIAEDNPELFNLNEDGRITINNFIGDHDPGEYLDDRYSFGFGPTLDLDKLREFSNTYADEYYSEDERLRLQNYESSERITAAYFMTKLVFGKLTLIPGLRVENTQTDFSGLFGRSFELEGQVFISSIDTLGQQNYTEFLPMFQMKYQVRPWMDVRAAATRTLARPNFFDLIPWQEINDIDGILQRGNAALGHTTAWNYDLNFSFYNKYGLFTIGGFHKRLNNVDYQRISRDTEAGSATRGYQLITRENLENMVSVLGGEIELQTNLRFLPKPFNGILLSANYTFLRSETFFPQLELINEGPPFFNTTIVDTLREGVLPNQPNSVLNLSIGYEYRGFSARLSMFRQGRTLEFVGQREEFDGYFREFTRWDFTAKQNLDKVTEGLSVFFNFNNISNTPEFIFLSADQRFPIEEEYFGYTMDLGVRYKF